MPSMRPGSWSGARLRSTTATARWSPPAQREAALSTLRGTVAGGTQPPLGHHPFGRERAERHPRRGPGHPGLPRRRRRPGEGPRPDAPGQRRPAQLPGLRGAGDVLAVRPARDQLYFGWYPGKANHSTGASPTSARSWRHAAHVPTQALVVTEFGAESTFNGPAKQKETYAFQSDYIRPVLKIVDRVPFVAGAIYWTLMEFAVKPDWDGGAYRHVPRDSIHNKGLIKYDGEPQTRLGVAAKGLETPLYRNVTTRPGDRHPGARTAAGVRRARRDARRPGAAGHRRLGTGILSQRAADRDDGAGSTPPARPPERGGQQPALRVE